MVLYTSEKTIVNPLVQGFSILKNGILTRKKQLNSLFAISIEVANCLVNGARPGDPASQKRQQEQVEVERCSFMTLLMTLSWRMLLILNLKRTRSGATKFARG